MVDTSETDDTAVLLKALLAVAVDLRERTLGTEPGARKTEVVLATAGLAPAEIARLLGKTSGSVRMTLSRARKSANSRLGE